jgi:hypothetical protein
MSFGTWWQADPLEDMILIYLVQNSIDLGPEAVTGIATRERVGAMLARPMFEKTVYAALGK